MIPFPQFLPSRLITLNKVLASIFQNFPFFQIFYLLIFDYSRLYFCMFRSLVVGSKNGYRLYSLSNVDDLELIYSNDAEETFMVERLFSSSLVATVAMASPRKLKVCHFKKGTEICNYSYSNTILAVRMNR
jgi:autophagy-related protein 18